MENQPKDKAKVQPSTAKKSITPSGKTTTSRAKAKPVDLDQIFVFFGSVVTADSTSAAGLTVIAYNWDVAGEDQLGGDISTADGAFRITYNEDQFRRSPGERGGLTCAYKA